MADKTHKTRGIVLKTVKYGDTSLIASFYTNIFGLQTYIVNGVRTSSKKGSNKAALFQPATILDLVVYHNSLKQINRIKEYQLAAINDNIFTNVIKNGVALYMVELVTRCLKEPECNEDLFAFVEDSLLHLNGCDNAATANFPVFFAVQLSNFFGFLPRNKNLQVLLSHQLVFDMQGGLFTDELPSHNYYIEQKPAFLLAELSKVMHPSELSQLRGNAELRRQILDALEIYYSLHVQDFGKLKTLPVLRELMS